MFKAEYIFIRILLAFIPGLITFYFVNQSRWILVLSVICITLFFALFLLNRFYKQINAYKFKGAIGVLIFSFFFAFGGLICLLNKDNLNKNYFAHSKFDVLKIFIIDEPQEHNHILRFKAKVISNFVNGAENKASGKILIALKLDSLKPLQLKYGDELLIGSNYTEVEPSYNPAEFNFKVWLKNQNIYHQTFVNQKDVYKTNLNKGNAILKYAINLREKQILKYRKLIKNDEAYAVASTLILGYRADLSQETLAAYSKTGTIHALSVSGAHVAIIYVVLNILLSFLDRKRQLKILKLVLICGLIWGYALITGLSASVVRSAIMITIFIVAKTFSKNTNAYNILAFSAFCQLLYNPLLIWDVGFQLSYLAVFGLVYLQPLIYKLVYVKNKWIDKLWNLIALSLAAQIVTFPLSIYYFHQFPIYFLLANLFILIPLTLMMYFGIAILIPVFEFLAPIFEWIVVKTNFVLHWIADLPLSTLSSIWISLPTLIVLIFGLAFLIYALETKRKKFLFGSIICFVIFYMLIAVDELNALNQQKIIYFSLRKNYAVAFIKSNTAVLQTDLTAKDKNYIYFVKPGLDSLKITQITFLKLGSDTLSNQFIHKEHQIIFGKYSVLIIDSAFNYKTLNAKASFNTIWLRNSSKFKIEQLKSQISFKKIIIDGSNNNYKIADFKKYADSNGIKNYILKKNTAYLINLKP